MIRSMTGFARRECQGPWGLLICELRTVNHRYLEVTLRLPEELKTLESELRQTISSALRRGKVDANVYLKNVVGESPAIELDSTVLTRLIAALRQVESALGASTPPNPLDILRWPGVIRDTERDTAPIMAAALELTTAVLNDLNEMRAREGTRIRELIQQRCAAMQAITNTIRARLPEIAARIRTRLTERIVALGTSGNVPNSDRLEQELVLYAHKMDIDEELDRLDSHLVEIATIIDSKEPAGRRLDFLMQELNREANTLSSKAQDADTTRAAVDLKVLIEQIREQVQNIE